MTRWILALSLMLQTALFSVPMRDRDQDPEDYRDNEKPTLYDTEQDARLHALEESTPPRVYDDSHYYRGGDRGFNHFNDGTDKDTRCVGGKCYRYNKLWVPDD